MRNLARVFIRSQVVILELAALGGVLYFLQQSNPSASTLAASVAFLLAMFTLLTGKGIPRLKHRGKALLVMGMAGYFALSGAVLFNDQREARLAELRQTNPVAYLVELREIDEDQWFSELRELDPDGYAAETARREEAAEAERLARCTDRKSAEAYVMIQTDVRRSLRAPSTAKFPGRYGAGTGHIGNCVYLVVGHFDAQNGFGVMLRGTFTGAIRYFPASGSWQTQSLSVN